MSAKLALVLCAACAAAPPAPRYVDPEDIPNAFPSELRAPTTADHIRIFAALHETKLHPLTAAGQLVSLKLRTAWSVPMVLDECGEVNASYNQRTRSIRICYELVAYANKLRGEVASALDDDMRLWILFATLHEIGHALIDQYELPTRSDSDAEDLADQFAALVIGSAGTNAPETLWRLLPAMTFFANHGERGRSSDSVHRNGDARAADITCIAIARAGYTESSSRCSSLTQAAAARWNELLAPYSRLESGTVF